MVMPSDQMPRTFVFEAARRVLKSLSGSRNLVSRAKAKSRSSGSWSSATHMVVPSDQRPTGELFPAATRVSKSSCALQPKGASEPRLTLSR